MAKNTLPNDNEIRKALDLIKLHIFSPNDVRHLKQSEDLHNAIQIIVTEFRKLGMLQEGAR